MNIEKNIKELENILAQMEKETISIEQGMELYTNAVALLRSTQNRLSEIEQKVEQIDSEVARED
ncbi:MAG: exodeoxyribonuclease VII small subunit [Halieaceae bacterium]|nr:exodeoxyribonuclease VII small subunit [Halieaceae bacterium]